MPAFTDQQPVDRSEEQAPETPPRGWFQFRLIDLIVGTVVISLLLAGIVVGLERVREAARRLQCTSNLKQIGLATLNFHDTHNGLPPLAIGDARASFFVLILPYCEFAGVYNLYSGGNAGGNTSLENMIDASSSNPPVSTWAAFTRQERDSASALSWMICPSRRARGIHQILMQGTSDLYAGPLGDYAVVFYDYDACCNHPVLPPPDTSPVSGWQLHQNPCDPLEVDRQQATIRLAHIDCSNRSNPDYDNWRPRDTIARVVDGTSNTLIVGEKHLRADELGHYSASQDDQDGVYLFTSNRGGRNYNVARNIGFPLANGPHDKRFTRGQWPAKGPHADFGFGSWHQGITLFLVADATVRPISNATDRNLLSQLGSAVDSIAYGCDRNEIGE